MVATQNPEELGLAHTPFQWQQGNTQPQKNFHRLLHQTKTQPGTVGAGFQYFGQVTEVSSQNFRQINTGVLQKQPPNCAFPTGVCSAAPKVGSLGIATKTFTFQDLCLLTENKPNTSPPQLQAFLEEKILQLKTSPASFSIKRTKMQNMSNPEGTHSRPHQHHLSTSFLSCTPVEDELSPVEDTETFARNLLAFISEKIAQYQKARALKNNENTFPSIVADPPSLVTVQAVEEHNSKAGKDPTSELEEAGDCATSVPENHSTEYPHIMREVSTCRNDEDESPGPMRVPRLISDQLTEKHHSSTSDCCPSQGESKLPLFDQLSGVSMAPKQIIEEDQLVRGVRSLEGVRPIHVHGVALQTDLLPEKTFEPLSYDGQNSPVDKTQIHADLLVPSQSERLGVELSAVKLVKNPEYEDISDDDQSEDLHEETLDLSVVNNPKYEDISEDDDMSEPATKLPNGHFEDLSYPPRIEDLQSENISEADSQKSDSLEVGRPYHLSRSQETQTNNEQMLFNNKDSAHLQSVAQVKEENLPEELIQNPASPKSVSSDVAHHSSHSFCDESCDGNLSVLQSSALFENEEWDDQIDDWIVIPITMSDVRFESESEDQEGLEKVLLKETQSNTDLTHKQGPTLAPTCASSEIEVFETLDSFVKATDVQIIDKFEVESSCMEQYSESEDTEDSCDYPSESKVNYITASRHLLEQTPEPLTPASEVSVLETEEEHGKVRSVAKGQTNRRFNEMREKLKQIIQAKVDGQLKVKRKITLNKTDNSSSDSELDSEGVQRGVSCPKKKRRFPLCSETRKEKQIENNAEPESVQHETEKHDMLNSGTILLEFESKDESYQKCKQKAKRRRRSKAREDPMFTAKVAQQSQSELDDKEVKDMSKDLCSDQQMESKSEPEFVQHVTDGHSGPIIIDSDLEDESSQNHITKAEGRRFSTPDIESSQHKAVIQKISTSEDIIVLSSDSDSDDEQKSSSTLGLAGCPDNSCVRQTTQPPEPFDNEFETARERLGETRPPSANPIQPQMTPKETSALLESGQEVGKRQLCKRAANGKEIVSFNTEDSSDDTFSATDDGPLPEPMEFVGATANRKPENNRLSYYPPKRQHQSMDRGADPVSVITCLKLQSQAQTQAHENPAASSKVCEKTLNKSSTVQNTVAKPPQVSRQLSLPSHPGLSDNYSSSFSTNGPLTEVRQSSVPLIGLPLSGVFREVSTAGNFPRSRHSSSTNEQRLTPSKVQRSHSYNDPPTSNQLHSPSEGSSYSTPQLARTRVFHDWKKSFPNKGEVRRRRSRMEDSQRTTHPYSSSQGRPGPSHSDSTREVRPGPSCRDDFGEARPGPSFCHSAREVRPERISRRSHKSSEITPPLMKKTIGDYKQLPKATNRDPARKQSYPVGENYKWRNSKKGPSKKGMQC